MNNRRQKEKRAPVLKWMGNMSVISDFLQAQSWCSSWGPFKLLNSFFRSLGVVVFSGNPFTGVLIFVGMIIGNPHVAIAAAMAGVISILTSKLIKVRDQDVCDGVSVFNSILFGAVLTAVAKPAFGIHLDYQYWITLAVGSFMTTIIDQGFQAMMAPSRLPVQSVPFNFAATLLLLVLRTKYHGFDYVHQSQELDNGTISLDLNSTNPEVATGDVVDWTSAFEGTIKAAGQIYGLEAIEASIFIWIGYLIYSPILATVLYAGSVLGSFLAILLQVPALPEVYAGLWSYNSMLAAGGMAFFVAPTPLCILLALVSGVLALAVQVATLPLFLQHTMPVLSFPFNVAIMVTLAISFRKGSPLKFIEERTFPEEHLCRHYGICGCRRVDDSDDEELVIPLKMMSKTSNHV